MDDNGGQQLGWRTLRENLYKIEVTNILLMENARRNTLTNGVGFDIMWVILGEFSNKVGD